MKRVAESSRSPWQEPVVDVELDLDALVANDLLDPGHLLHLEAHRVEALEDQGHDRAERHAPVPLTGDDPGPVVLTHPLVGAQVEDVGQGQTWRRTVPSLLTEVAGCTQVASGDTTRGPG